MAKSSKLRITTSKRVSVSSHRSLACPHRSALSLGQVVEKRQKTEQKRAEDLFRLASTAHQQLAQAGLETGITIACEDLPVDSNDVHDAGEWSDLEDTNESELEDLLDCSPDDTQVIAFTQLTKMRPHHIRDKRNWRDRIGSAHDAWEADMADLAHAYLEWKHRQGRPSTTEPTHVFHVQLVGIYEFRQVFEIQQYEGQSGNVALILSGCLGSSPQEPTTAFTLEVLELYHQIRRRQSAFSIQAMAKVLCALNSITYTRGFRNRLACTFDAYLWILRHVKQQLDQALGRDTPEWHLLYGCPACGYTTKDEQPLQPKRLHSIDGNFSLSRQKTSGSADLRQFKSRYHISPEQVNIFKDEVKRRSKPTSEAPGNAIAPCSENWVASKSAREGTVKFFEQTGIFVSACRHGIVETFAEMRQSGELAKYALATINKIIDTCGDGQLIGSDIGCKLSSTVANSSLRQKARSLNLKIIVNAFHGHAHNRLCQLRFHPMYTAGVGIEDLETCERIFSSSNHVSRLVRHASYFHWLQFIDLHFDQWNLDKYMELSTFLYNNYKQALDIIKNGTNDVEQLKKSCNYDDHVFTQWKDEELAYLQELSTHPPDDILVLSYIEMLEKLAVVEHRYLELASVPLIPHPHEPFQPSTFTPTTAQAQAIANARAIEVQRRTAFNNFTTALHAVDDLEMKLGITERWSATNEKYKNALADLNYKRFIKAVDALEGLVVQRLFELSKANLSGTGYKMRKHIAKAIARRSTTLRNALKKYNELAPLQKPPRPTLQYSDVISYACLGEFMLLKHLRHEMLTQPWSVPSNREIMSRYFKICGAREEIQRLNMEVKHLFAWVEHEDQHILSVSRSLKETHPVLSAELATLAKTRHRLNNIHRSRLQDICNLSGYTGVKLPFNVALELDDQPGPGDPVDIRAITAEEDDALADEVDRLGVFLEHVD